MQYQHVYLESLAYLLPPDVVSSDAIEARLEPLYQRLRLPRGRLELISGVRERRLWRAGTLPGDKSSVAATMALEAAEFPRRKVGTLIHASVCRDHLEPATACRVHHQLGLSSHCLIYDLSNACLGLMNATCQIADGIELGRIDAGIAVGTESSRPLLETTVTQLNQQTDLTRGGIKSSLASLTIGSASVALLLVHERFTRYGTRLRASVAYADTRHHALCQSGRDEALAEGMQPLMETDSEALLREGIAVGQSAFQQFQEATGWNRNSLAKTVCHQVGKAHRLRLLEALGLSPERDYSTVEYLGNTGSAALPVSLALAAQNGFLHPGDQVGLLGIGSGINSLMIGLDWQSCAVVGLDESTESALTRGEFLNRPV